MDNLKRPVAEGGIVVTLRADLTGGVSLGGDASIEPGETRRVDTSIALQLITSGRAVVGTEVKQEPGNSESALAAATAKGRKK